MKTNGTKIDTAQIQKTSLNVIKKILIISSYRMDFGRLGFLEKENSIQIDFLDIVETKLSKRTFITEMLEQIAFTIKNDISEVEMKVCSKNETEYSLLSRFIRYFNTKKTIKVIYDIEFKNEVESIILKDLNMFPHF